MGLRNAGINFQQYEETHLMETPDFSVESPTLAHQEDKQAETAINRQVAARATGIFHSKECQTARMPMYRVFAACQTLAESAAD